jgi:hypothetical protein
MGDFRGNYPRRRADWCQQGSYWQGVRLESYAQMDIASFLKAIREIKRKEAIERGMSFGEAKIWVRDEVKITYVGHSLGGEALMMYLIHYKLQKVPHHINSAILLSPAGFHEDTSLTIKIIAWLVAKVVSRFTSHIALPESIIDLIQKLHNDLVKLPSTRDLFTNITEFFVGGEKQINQDNPIWKSALIISSVCKFGFSIDLCKQFHYQFSRPGFRLCNLENSAS